ncbi:MAG: glycosyltransferase family 2 protein, partial [Alistipes sp.]|nr:glycosyltransferase family 2 protein [Alistipes sp.]
MRALHIITPVKDSIPSTIQTVNAIRNSKIGREYTYTIYNDFSSDENTATLEREVARWGDVELVNLKDITTHPSPNYLLVLQISQQRAIREDADLLIVESDVE